MKYVINEHYLKVEEPSSIYKKYAWDTAIGLQAVDGLKVSNYLYQTKDKHISQEISIEEANSLIHSYYKSSPIDGASRTEEADLVSARIAQILGEAGFTFSAKTYLNINKRLFEGIYTNAGKAREYNITKAEWVLDGDTVIYGNALELLESLEYDIEKEANYSYSNKNLDEVVEHISKFAANLWQIHVFSEGNTRTTAVFLIKYLSSLGFDITNDVFAKNAGYFRNALVRANYSNITKGIYETTWYLELFFRNLLLAETNELKSRYLHVNLSKVFSAKTKEHIKVAKEYFSVDRPFTRNDLAQILNITSTPASELIRKMKAQGIIENVKGRGKYQFKE